MPMQLLPRQCSYCPTPFTRLASSLAQVTSFVFILGGTIPSDQMMTVDRLLKISVGLFSFFCAVEILGIIVAVAFLTFNICHSDHR